VGAMVRKARLRSEYASWYPDISVTTWYPVATLVRKVTRQLVHGEGDPRSSPRWAVGGRTLDDRHFEFRGGVERDARWRTRAGDTTVWPAAARQPRPSSQGSGQEEKHRR
jgi:hypothetical protein